MIRPFCKNACSMPHAEIIYFPLLSWRCGLSLNWRQCCISYTPPCWLQTFSRMLVVGVLHCWLYKELLDILYWKFLLDLNFHLNLFKILFNLLEQGDWNWMIFLEIYLRPWNVPLYVICGFSYKSIIPARSFLAFSSNREARSWHSSVAIEYIVMS